MFALKQRFKAEVLAVLNSNRNGYFYEVPGTWRALFYFQTDAGDCDRM